MLVSLVGNLYNVSAKLSSNRLCCFNGSLISKSQSTFVHGRKILDGMLIANEMVDDDRCLKKELLFFKVNFENAFDYVD